MIIYTFQVRVLDYDHLKLRKEWFWSNLENNMKLNLKTSQDVCLWAEHDYSLLLRHILCQYLSYSIFFLNVKFSQLWWPTLNDLTPKLSQLLMLIQWLVPKSTLNIDPLVQWCFGSRQTTDKNMITLPLQGQ